MSELCGFDSPVSSDIRESDCYSLCLFSGCTLVLLSNEECDEACNTIECGFDNGECGFCNDGCFELDLADEECQTSCSHVNCYYDSSVCQECSQGCSPSMLGNGTCDPACNFSLCGFDYGDCTIVNSDTNLDSSSYSECSVGCERVNLGNKLCEEDCNTPECNYDDYDCLCSDECFPEDLAECKEQCQECYSCQTDCSKACASDMIGNGTCDDSCWNEQCQWDLLDCGCAPDCKFQEISSCKDECLVLSCNYGSVSGYDPCQDSEKIEFAKYVQIAKSDFSAIASFTECQDASSVDYMSSPCDEDKIRSSQNQCVEECDFAECAYSFGNCSGVCGDSSSSGSCEVCFEGDEYSCLKCSNFQFFSTCVDQCPIGYEITASFPYLCVPMPDNSSEDNPGVYYVDPSVVNIGNGSEESPFRTLSVALVSIHTKYSTIIVLGDLDLEPIPSDYPMKILALSISDPLNKNSFDSAIIKIEGNSHTLSIHSDEFMRFYVKGTLELNSVTISSKALDDSCSGNYCNYCPYVACEGQICTYDSGENTGSYYTKCSQFHNLDLFYVEGSLILNDVRFYDLRMELKSLINFVGKELVMNDTEFIKVRVRSDIVTAVIIGNSESGNIDYKTGSVSLLNDGYEIDLPGVRFNGFMVVWNINSLSIESVRFDYNIIYAEMYSSRQPLVEMKIFNHFTIHSCTFEYNYLAHGIIKLNSDNVDIQEYSLNDNNVIYELSYDHFIVKDTSFKKNYMKDTGIIYATYKRFLQNVLLENLTMEENALEDQEMIAVINKEQKDEYNEPGYLKARVSNEYRWGLANERYFRMKNVTIDSNSISDFGILKLDQLANAEISNSTITNSSLDRVDLDYFLIDFFIGNSESYVQQKTNLYFTAHLFHLIYLVGLNHIHLANNEISSNNLYSRVSLIHIRYVEKLILESSQFSSNNIYVFGGGIFYLLDVKETYVDNCICENNNNSELFGLSCIYMDSNLENILHIRNSSFRKNRSLTGGAVLTTVTDLKVEDSIFEGNEIIEGFSPGIAHVKMNPSSSYKALLANVTFNGNIVLNGSGAALYISEESNADSEYKLEVIDCVFTNNIASLYGSAIYIQGNLVIHNDSYIQDSYFLRNSQYSGALAVRNSIGKLSIVSSLFDSNIGEDTSSIYVYGANEFELSIFSSNFTNNQASDGLHIESPNLSLLISMENCLLQFNQQVVIKLYSSRIQDNGSQILNNSGLDGCGFSLTKNSTGQLKNTVISRNYGLIGVGLFLSMTSSVTCDSCIISHNTASDHYAGIYSENSHFILNNTQIFENTSLSDISVILVYGSSYDRTQIYNTSIFSNYFPSQYSVSVSFSTLYMENVKFFDNVSDLKDPGILVSNSLIEISGSEFYNIDGNRGSIFQLTYSTINITDSTFYDINAEDFATIVYGRTSFITIQNSTFYNLKASKGTAFNLNSYSVLTIIDSVFDNILSYSDSMIYMTQCSIVVKGSTIKNFEGPVITGYLLDLFQVKDSQFLNGSGGRAIYIFNTHDVLIENTVIKNIQAQEYGIGIFLFSDLVDVFEASIANLTISDNKGLSSAGIYSENYNVAISDSYFENNTATDLSLLSGAYYGLGGAILVICINSNCRFSIESSTFVGNSARIKGGAIACVNQVPLLHNNEFFFNSAPYGNDVSSFPVNIVQIDELENPISSSISQLSSGEFIEDPVYVALVDHYGQIVKSDNKTTALIYPLIPDLITFGVTTETASQGVFNFSRFGVTAHPNSTISLQVDCNDLEDADSVHIDFFIRYCTTGEVIAGKTCQYCETGTYSFNVNDFDCNFCMSNAICYGGSDVVPKEGYWRYDKYSPIIWKCPNPNSCLGSRSDSISYIGECAEGYKGNKCQSCDEGFFRISHNNCQECPSIELASFIIILSFSGFVLLSSLIAKLSFHSVYYPTSIALVYAKIMLDYLHMSISFLNLEYTLPNGIGTIYSVVGFTEIIFNTCFAVECYEDDPENYFYKKSIYYSVFPLISILMTAVFWGIYALVKRKNSYMKYEFIMTTIVLAYLMNPYIIKHLSYGFICSEIKPNEYWLRYDLDVICNDSKYLEHILMIILPSIMLWAVLCPLLMFGILYKNRKNMHKVYFRKKYGFFVHGYSRDYYFWDFIVYWVKMIVILLPVILDNFALQCLSLMGVLAIFIYVSVKSKPFIEKKLNKLEVSSFVALLMTSYFTLFFDMGSVYETYALYVVSIVFHLYFIINWLGVIINLLLRFLSQYFPRLRRLLYTGNQGNLQDRSPFIVGNGTDTQFVLTHKTESKEQHTINFQSTMNDLYLMRMYADVIDRFPQGEKDIRNYPLEAEDID